MPYVLGLLWVYLLFLWTERRNPAKSRYLLLGGLVFPLLLAVFRYSGTDTYPIYEQILWRSFSEKTSTGLEPGFDFLSRFLMALTGSEVFTVRFLAVIFTGLLGLFVWRADPTERYFLFLFFFPSFFYQYGMNTIRSGLALALILLAWQSLRRDKWGVALGLGGIALTFHYSALLVLLFLGLVEGLRLRKAVALRASVVFLLVASLLFLMEREYFLSKLSLYLTQIQAIQNLPGASRSLMVALLALSLLASPLSREKKVLGGGLLLLFTGASQAIALISVAGARLLELASFIAPLAIIRLHDLEGRAVQRGFLLLLVLAGLLGAIFFFRQQARDWEGRFTGSSTPFFPYRIVFQHNPCPPSFYYPQASPRNCPFFGQSLPPLHPPVPE